VSQQSADDPPYLQLTGQPIRDFTTTAYTLLHFRHQIEASGWSTTSTAVPPAPITVSYSGDQSFQGLLEDVTADFGICYTVDQQNLRIAFANCP
jgi:hypothetical protein